MGCKSCGGGTKSQRSSPTVRTTSGPRGRWKVTYPDGESETYISESDARLAAAKFGRGARVRSI